MFSRRGNKFVDKKKMPVLFFFTAGEKKRYLLPAGRMVYYTV